MGQNSSGGGSGSASIDSISGLTTTGKVTGSLFVYTGSTWSPSAVADYFKNGGDLSGGARTIGNADNFSFGIETNNIERVRVLGSGEVGINSTTNADIDDAQLFIRSNKQRDIIVYNIGGQTNIVLQTNNDSSVRKESGRITSEFSDGIANNEYGTMCFSVSKGGSVPNGTGVLSIGQYFDLVSASHKDNVGVIIDNEGLGSSPNALVHVACSDSLGGVSTANYKLVYVTYNGSSIIDIRANGWIILANLPTSSAGLPSKALWNDNGTIKQVA